MGKQPIDIIMENPRLLELTFWVAVGVSLGLELAYQDDELITFRLAGWKKKALDAFEEPES